MKNKKELIINIVFCFLAFFIPLLLSCITFANNGFHPFVNNGKTVMMIDMAGQYISFFRYYKAVLSGNGDLLYTLGKTFGGDMMSIFTYYLASPFNLLLLFFNEESLTVGLLFITILKLSTSGLTCYLFLRNEVKNNIYALLFSISYALCSYAFVYHFDIMWLDGMYLLPVIALGIKKIINKKSPLLYVVSLCLTLMCSWYIGFMSCMFSVIFFISETIKKYNFKSRKEIINICIHFAISSILGGLLSSFVWASALTHLSGTKGNTNIISNVLNNVGKFYNFFDVFKFSFSGNFNDMSHITTYGINIYVGAISAIFCLIYFINDSIPLKKRLSSLCVILIYLLAFSNIGIDILFHGGAQPTWFPFRYSFIFSFYIVYLGCISMNHIKELHPVRLLIPLVFIIVFILVTINTESHVYEYQSYIYILIVFATALCIILLKKYPLSNQISLSFLFLIQCSTLLINANNNIETLNRVTGGYVSQEVYLKDEEVKRTINNIKANDTSLYRLEKTFKREGTYNAANNDAMYYQYNGLSHFSSNEKRDVMEYMARLGFHYNHFWEDYSSGSTLSINSFLGVKYILTHKKENCTPWSTSLDTTALNTFVDYLNVDKDLSSESINVYENPYALSLFNVVNRPYVYENGTHQSFTSEGTYVDFIDENGNHIQGNYWYDLFEFQNEIFKSMVNITDENGEAKKIFNKIELDEFTSNLREGYIEDSYLERKIYKNIRSGDQTTFKITTKSNYPCYYHFKNHFYYQDYLSGKFNLMINSCPIQAYNYHVSGINGLPIKDGQQKISLIFKNDFGSYSIMEQFYYEDLDVLKEYVNAIKSQNVKINSFSSSKYSLSVDVKKDNQALLLTLPYEENFKITIDGNEVDHYKAYHIFTAVDVDKGQHNIEIQYIDKGYKIGLGLSFISIIFSMLYCVYYDVVDKKINKILKINKSSYLDSFVCN